MVLKGIPLTLRLYGSIEARLPEAGYWASLVRAEGGTDGPYLLQSHRSVTATGDAQTGPTGRDCAASMLGFTEP